MHGNVEFIVEGSSPDGGVGDRGAYAGPEEVGFAVGTCGGGGALGRRALGRRSTPSAYAEHAVGLRGAHWQLLDQSAVADEAQDGHRALEDVAVDAVRRVERARDDG